MWLDFLAQVDNFDTSHRFDCFDIEPALCVMACSGVPGVNVCVCDE